MNTIRNLFALSLGAILMSAGAGRVVAEDAPAASEAPVAFVTPVAHAPKKPAKSEKPAGTEAEGEAAPGERSAEPAPSPEGEAKPEESKDAAKPAAAKSGALKTFHFTGLLHLTGDLAAEGKAFRDGIQLAAEDSADALAASGKAVEIIFDDTGYDLAKTNTVAERALTDESVSGILVSTLHEMKAIAAAVERGHLPSIVLWDSSPELEEMGEYIFAVGPWSPDVGRKAADFAEKTLKAHSAFVVSTNNEWSNTASKAFFAETLKNGADLVGSEAVNPEDRDFLGIITKIRSSRAEAVYAPLATNLMTFAKQIHAGGVTTPIITSDVINAHLISESRGVFEGYYQTMTTEPAGEGAEKLKKLYEKRYGKEIPNLTLTALGFDAMKLYIHAILSGASTRAELKDALAKAKDVPGAFGPMTMSEKGSVPKFVGVYQVKDGAFTLVEKPDGTSNH